MSAVSDALKTNIINHFFRNSSFTSPPNVFLALFTTMPLTDGTGGVEVAGGSYARQDITFGADVDGITYNTAVLTFPSMPACTIVGGGIYTLSTSGVLLTLPSLSSPQIVAATRDYLVQIGDVVVRIP